MLIRNGEPAADAYSAIADDAPLPDGPVIVSLKRFLAERAALSARGGRLGVRLCSHETPDALVPDLDRIALVVLEFPAFRDGRPFSSARRLRTRLKFTGEIRASGDFLADQIAFLLRVGFNAFELPPSVTPDLAARALREISHVYQPAADGRKTIADLRR